VALTFDDCDSPTAWERILDVLDEDDVGATFFPNGIRVEECPSLARRTIASGHAVGSHGYDHPHPTHVDRRGMRRRLERDVALWARIGGRRRLTMFRPPYGEFDDVTLGAAADAGFDRVVLWDVDPNDWACPGPDEVYRRTLEGVRPGSIVLLHVVDATADALGPMVACLQARGLTPVSIPRLLEDHERAVACSQSTDRSASPAAT
jgi:peptidoglycan/xylan/chitin deacetylase (PgdA/CDA1 family)